MDVQGIITVKVIYALTWTFVASYYFIWGSNEPSITVSIDESGWNTDEIIANEITR